MHRMLHKYRWGSRMLHKYRWGSRMLHKYSRGSAVRTLRRAMDHQRESSILVTLKKFSEYPGDQGVPFTLRSYTSGGSRNSGMRRSARPLLAITSRQFAHSHHEGGLEGSVHSRLGSDRLEGGCEV